MLTYDRPSGLTQADRAKAAADAQALAGFEGVQGKPIGPTPSADGKALQTVVVFDLGSDGWQKAPGIADRIRGLPGGIDGLTVHVTGPFGWPPTRRPRSRGSTARCCSPRSASS